MAVQTVLGDETNIGASAINKLWTFPSLGRSKLSAGTVDDAYVKFNKSPGGGFTMRDSWSLRPKVTDKYAGYY